MMQEIVVIISVIFVYGPTYTCLSKPSNEQCGTFNQTGSCPRYGMWYWAYVNDTLKLFLERDSWILAAAASNAKDAPPPSKTCVTISATDTKKHSECIFNSYNHTPHMARRVQIMGYDEDDVLQVHSVGAIHTWPLDELFKPDNHYREYLYGKNYMLLNAAIKSTTCWSPQTQKFDAYRFIITNLFFAIKTKNVAHKTQYLLLIGVNARGPTPEIHLGLLADRKPDRADINYVIYILEEARRKVEDIYFMVAYPDYMPPLKIRCIRN